MQIFNYKNNIYLLDGDITIKKTIYFQDSLSGEYTRFVENYKDYTICEKYEVVKGSYNVIDFFDTEKEAILCVDAIRAQLNFNNISICEDTTTHNIDDRCCCVV